MIEIQNEDEIIAWGEQLMGDRHKEAVESIIRENITREFVYLIDLERKKYLVFFEESSGTIQKADMTMPVNRDHKKILKKIWVKRIEGIPLYDLKV